MNLLELALLGTLITYRLTLMLHEEKGPGNIFARLRTRLGVKFDEHSRPYGTNWVSEGILCFYCLSVWISIPVFALLWFIPQIGIFLLPFALSGGAVFLRKWAG